MSLSTASKALATLAASGASKQTQASSCPEAFSSGDVTRSMSPTAVANDTSVGGTSRSSKLPDMESLPPMAPTPKSTCAMSAPSRADTGLPQRSGSSRSFSKYSWNVRYILRRSKPVATSLATESSTAM